MRGIEAPTLGDQAMVSDAVFVRVPSEKYEVCCLFVPAEWDSAVVQIFLEQTRMLTAAYLLRSPPSPELENTLMLACGADDMREQVESELGIGTTSRHESLLADAACSVDVSWKVQAPPTKLWVLMLNDQSRDIVAVATVSDHGITPVQIREHRNA